MGLSYRVTVAVLVAAACTPPTEAPLLPPPPPPNPLTGAGPFIVSNPVAGVPAGLLAEGAASATSQVTWVSLPPGSIPQGTSAQLRVESSGATASAPLVNGGFDPVALSAQADDTLSITIAGSSGTIATYRTKVPSRKPPLIVRTRPEKNKRDVPLNASILVVFSEPVDPASVTPANFEVRSGTSSVAGAFVLNPDHTSVEFTPAVSLESLTEYTLFIRTGIQDSEGTPLEAAETVPFTTEFAPGWIRVTLATTGIELAPDSFSVQVDNGTAVNIEPQGVRIFGGIISGSHLVTLNGLGARCTTTGANPRAIAVAAGDTSFVSFAVTCAASSGGGQLAFVRVVAEPGASLAGSAWSPDGLKIAAVFCPQFDDCEVQVMNADGSARLPLAAAIRDGGPSWSPDGSMIAFTARDCVGCIPSIRFVRADGTGGGLIVSNGTHPAWRP